MPRIFFALTTLVLTWSVGVTTVWSATPYQQLLSKTPSEANALIMISTAEVRASAIAKQQIAARPGNREAFGRHVFAMPKVDYAVLASQLDFDSLRSTWQLGLYAMSEDPVLSEVARRHKGRLETISGRPCVWLPPDAHLVDLGSRIVGLIEPANRQFVARWLKEVQHRNAPQLSPYLTEASSYPDNVGTEIIMALDLEQTVSENQALERLDAAKTLLGVNVDRKELASLLSSIRGVTLGVRSGEKLSAKLRVDFGRDAAIMAPFAKPFLLERLAAFGAMINDFEHWNAEVRGSTVYLGGELSVNGLQNILSLVDPPAPDLANHSPVKTSPGESNPPAVDPKLTASLHNFHAVKEIVKDSLKTGDVKTWGAYAQWLQRYAKKIDNLPILDVDPDLLDFSAKVANVLREQSYGYKKVGFAGGRESENLNVYWNWGPWYNAYATTGPSDSQLARKDAAISAAESQAASMNTLDEATARMRRLLTERYKVEF